MHLYGARNAKKKNQPRTKIDIFELETDFVYDAATTAASLFLCFTPIINHENDLFFHTCEIREVKRSCPNLSCDAKVAAMSHMDLVGTALESCTSLRLPEDAGLVNWDSRQQKTFLSLNEEEIHKQRVFLTEFLNFSSHKVLSNNIYNTNFPKQIIY